MDNIFTTNISKVLNDAFIENEFRCFVSIINHSVMIKIKIGPKHLEQTLILKIVVINTEPKQLYFELVKTDVLYLPYIVEIWHTLKSDQIKKNIISEWNKTCQRNNLPDKIAMDYF